MKTHESMLSLRLFSSWLSTWMIDRIWSYFPHCFSWIFIYIILFWKIKIYKFIIHSQSYPRFGIDGYDWKWIIQIYIILFFDSNPVENYTIPYDEDNSRHPTKLRQSLQGNCHHMESTGQRGRRLLYRVCRHIDILWSLLLLLSLCL